jgi:hypothetical protein
MIKSIELENEITFFSLPVSLDELLSVETNKRTNEQTNKHKILQSYEKKRIKRFDLLFIVLCC